MRLGRGVVGRPRASGAGRDRDLPPRAQRLCRLSPGRPRNSQEQRRPPDPGQNGLFPGYLFIASKPQWHQARWTVGILALIMGSDRPREIGDEIVEAIRQREIDGVVVLPKRIMAPGTKVRVLTGPFAGHLALYEGQPAPERVCVLLALLGSQVRATLPAGAIARA
jgi:transcription antitermination factor NusG